MPVNSDIQHYFKNGVIKISENSIVKVHQNFLSSLENIIKLSGMPIIENTIDAAYTDDFLVEVTFQIKGGWTISEPFKYSYEQN